MKGLILFTTVCSIAFAAEVKRYLFETNPFHYPGGGFGGSTMTGSGSTGTYSPCTPQQAVCTLSCANGYMKGPMGCDYCMCNPNPNPQQQSTMAPDTTKTTTTTSPTTTTTTPKPTTTTTSKAPYTEVQTTADGSGMTVDPCLTARMLCAARCDPGGFLIDPNDCTFCACKNQIVNN